MAEFGSVTVVRDGIAPAASTPSTSSARMILYTESGGLALDIDIAPREIEYGGLPLDWSEAERSGERPLLLHKSIPLRTMSFSFMLTDKIDMQRPQTNKFADLQELARTFERLMVRFSPTEQGLWRITDLSISSELRTAATDEIARATVSITLTEASDPAPSIGPISKPAPPPPSQKPVNKTHTVKKGETLWDLAKKYYGNGASWPRILDANREKISDPHLIKSGMKLTIP